LKFEEYYDKVKDEIEQKLREILNQEDDTVRRIYGYVIESGGKRFRPALTLLACDALSGDRERALTYACAVELLHNSTLIHDDVIDGDLLRRGRPTLWRIIDKLTGFVNDVWLVLFGKPKFRDPITYAILAGDAMLATATVLLEHPEAKDAMADTVKALLLGALKEATHPKEYITKGLYYTVITLKTASLFATATYLGALCSTAPKKQKEALRQFGKRLGIMYQMVDDYIDGDAPDWLIENFEEELKEQYELALKELEVIPDSPYKEALKDCIVYMLRGLAKEGGDEVQKQIERVLRSVEKL
jgi:geranylgeranyl pyrophosphate synthase